MLAPCLLLCEKKCRFALAVRSRSWWRQGTRLVETCGLAQIVKALAEAPGSLAAIEVTRDNLANVLDFLERIERDHALSKAVALLAKDDPGLELLLREAGAIDVLSSVSEAPRLVRLARRQLALAPPPQRSFRESAWQRLPWQAYGTLRREE